MSLRTLYLLILTVLVIPRAVSAENYACTAEEYFRQNSSGGGAPVLSQCGVYWPEAELDRYEIVKVGMPDLTILGVRNLRDEEVKPFRKIHSDKDFIIISDDQIWSEQSDWCGRVSNVYTLRLGPGGVPDDLLSGYVLLNADAVISAEEKGGYRRVELSSIRGSLDDFIRVGSKLIISDDDRSVVIKLAEKYMEYMSRGVFFSSVTNAEYLAQRKKLKLTRDGYTNIPKKYQCRR